MSSESVIFRTKNVSKSATGRGRTSIATKAMIPKGKKEFTKFGAKPYLRITKSVNARSMPEQNSTVEIEP